MARCPVPGASRSRLPGRPGLTSACRTVPGERRRSRPLRSLADRRACRRPDGARARAGESGSNASAQIFIFSPKYDEIADFINSEFGRGVTALDGKGWYTQNNVTVLMTIVRKKETSILFRKIKEIDPEAFISMASVMGVYGQGFDKIKG